MTATDWATWVGIIGGTLAIVGMVYRQVIRPLARGLQRFADLIERLQDVLNGWPQLLADVTGTQTQLTGLGLKVGELNGRLSTTRTDLDTAFDRIRDLETRTPTHT